MIRLQEENPGDRGWAESEYLSGTLQRIRRQSEENPGGLSASTLLYEHLLYSLLLILGRKPFTESIISCKDTKLNYLLWFRFQRVKEES